jgi:GTP cyclohydrolase FolE2
LHNLLCPGVYREYLMILECEKAEKPTTTVILAAHKNPRFVENCVRQMAKKVLAEFEYLSGDSVVTIKQTNKESIPQRDA